jgi:DNA polymerase I-like protein with 3'-5' exonuclease and polymerase domains
MDPLSVWDGGFFIFKETPMPEITVTHKPYFASGRPFISMNTANYLDFLQSKKRDLASGFLGVYLSREIIFNQQKLYFPFIDIDGLPGLHGDEKIASSVFNAKLTIDILKKLKVDAYFKLIATGGAGFRMMSNLLIDQPAYLAFIDLVKSEMPHIHDLGPTVEMEMPHQLYVYKGHKNHNNHERVNRHSTLVCTADITADVLDPEYYKRMTFGKPDPDTIIRYLKNWFDEMTPVSDWSALGLFGEKIHQYQEMAKTLTVSPFSYLHLRKKAEPVTLEIIKAQLAEKNITCNIEKLKKIATISFAGLPCPCCGKTDSNAKAFPPTYKLKCFSKNCPASRAKGGLPLHQWAGIKLPSPKVNQKAVQQAPTVFKSIDEAREIIKSEILNPDNILLPITPGVGKTHVTLEVLAELAESKQVLYSSFNRALLDEAYEKIKTFGKDPSLFHKIESMENLCLKKSQLTDINGRGFSPSEFLCRSCEYREKCQYIQQKQNLGTGVYFVVHHMLQYLEPLFLSPDMIILDENLISGFLLKEKISSDQLRSLYAVLEGNNRLEIKAIIDLAQDIGDAIIREAKSYTMIINSKKISGPNVNEDSIIELLAGRQGVSEKQIKQTIKNVISAIDEHSVKNLYQNNVNFKAVKWLRGLIADTIYSYLNISASGQVSFDVKSITRIGYPETPFKILDATGDAHVCKALTGRSMKTVKLDVAWDSLKTHFQINTSRAVLEKSKDTDLSRLLTEMISTISASNVMVVTYKKMAQKVTSLCRQIDPSKSFMDFHFQGPRGINHFEQCDAVLVLGLPYENLNDSAQDACIMFPGKSNEIMRENWIETVMQNEMIQVIHRIRPVNKPICEIIIASSFWPSILPQPDQVIDKSRANKQELLIKRLEPFVKEFGFLNPDIGYLANVCQKKKLSIAQDFRKKIVKILDAITHLNSLEVISKDCLFSDQEENFDYHNITETISSQNNPISFEGKESGLKLNPKLNPREIENPDERAFSREKTILKCILVLYKHNTKNHLNQPFFQALGIQKSLIQEGISSDNDETFFPSNDKQWADLLNHFKTENPHFESFKIKLPHARGNFVEGVGIKNKAIEFYESLNSLKIFGQIKTETYSTIKQCIVPIPPIPDGHICLFIPPEHPHMSCLGIKDQVRPFVLTDTSAAPEDNIRSVLTNHQGKTITNEGKSLAQYFMNAGLEQCQIIDIVLNEKIISNGELKEIKNINWQYVLKKYGYNPKSDNSLMTSNLHEIWKQQEKIIQDLKLKNVVELESRLIWVTAKIETVGIALDVDGIKAYQEDIQDTMRGIEKRLSELIPEHPPLGDNQKLKAHLNRTYRLELTDLKKDSLSQVKSVFGKMVFSLILEYRHLKNTLQSIQRYIQNSDSAGRTHDVISQNGTVNGRFTRDLHGVKKHGPMRQFFRAAEGYKLIVADYSSFEARIIAGLSKDPRAIEIFKSGKDFYAEVARMLFDDVKDKEMDLRSMAKSIVLGLINGQHAFSIHRMLCEAGMACTQDDAERWILRYFDIFPGFAQFRDQTLIHANTKRFLQTRMGRRLQIIDATKERTMKNFPVTATGSDGFKLALLMLDKKLEGLDTRIIHLVHDEIIVEAAEDIAETVADLVRVCMAAGMNELLPDVPFVVEPEVREAWG